MTTYSYNANTNVLEWVKYPNDTDTTRTNYTYDSMYRLATAAATTNTGSALSATYTYTDDLLTKLQTATTAYHFAYGDFALRSSIQVGSTTLASYTYTADRNRYLQQLTYGNQDFVRYAYDSYGRLTGQTYEDGSTVTYAYDNTGALAPVPDSASGIKTTYYYDLTDRLIQYAETGTGHSHAVGYVYDRENKLTSLTEKINGTAFTTSYTYDDDNRVSSITDRGITESYTYDAYGRVTQKVTKNGSATVLTETYTYRTVSGKPTGQIATHRSVSSGRTVTYTYNYDANGNITSVSDGTHTTTYVYDSANQLTRENNQAEGVTRTFTYDRAGNMTAWTEYAYTTGTLGAATATHGYTYGNSNWRDQLTAWNGNTITSDTIGNMLSDGTRTYTWRNGRELATVTKGGVTWTNTYNADGIRTKRTNGTNTYSYIYNGGRLSQMTVDGTVMNFAYDASGTPMAVTYGGATYYYATNIQGDVVAILNASGTAVVTYTYDAWGNILTTTGTLASTLGTHNPLRYRGYVYDQETGLYYLQSRYYNPEMGRFLSADSLVSTGQGILGNNMFAYCLNNPVCHADPSGHMVAFDMFIQALDGDGSDQEYDDESELAKKLKKSHALLQLFEENVEKFIASNAKDYCIYHGTFSTYSGTTFADKDLALSVGAANYTMTITKETRTAGFLWIKQEQTRYVATVIVHDIYDFTEWRDGSSFGSIMNNIAYIGQIMGYIKAYRWQAVFTIATDWE